MALIKTSDELRTFLPLNKTFDPSGILPFVTEAEVGTIIPAISQAQYDDLNGAYNNEPYTLSPAQTKLLAKVQAALTCFAFNLWLPFGQVQIDNSGIRIANTDTMKTAFQWQTDKLDQSSLQSGFSALEQLLVFMEANKSDYSLWAGSSSYTVYKSLFITTAIQFDTLFSINQSRLVFISLMPAMKKVEDFFIRAVLDPATFASIKSDITSGTVGADNQALLNYIQPAVAHLAIAKGLTDKSITLNDRGVLTFRDVGRITTKAYEPAASDILDAIQRQANEDGRAYLKILTDYLNANASSSKYTSYFSSSLYVAPPTPGNCDDGNHHQHDYDHYDESGESQREGSIYLNGKRKPKKGIVGL